MSGKVARDASQVSAVFANFESHRHNIELGFASVFVMLSLTMLISAVWMGLTFANQLVGPIRRLIRATDEVASGNLYVQVPTRRSEGDLGHLGETFNKMTMELRHQRNRLTAANALNDERRAFIEAVLSGVPASVIGVDAQDVITVSNAAADKLLCGDDPRGLVGRNIGEVFPQVAQILDQARSMNLRSQQAQATWTSHGRERLLNVRVTGDPQRGDHGAVVTLDDISELVTAQRSAAWADVARRIAHEIKNPLTPIQLSAERLKRRYGKHIVEGKDVFDQCTDTIIRQVDDIKRMVDEFSSFARMPKARPAEDDLSDCVRQALFLMRVGRPDIAFEDELPPRAGDRRFRSPVDLPGADQRAQERRGGHRRARPARGEGQDRRLAGGRRRRRSHHRQRQRQGLSERGSPQADRALRHHPRRGHRPRPADRHQDLRGSSRRGRTARRPRPRRRRARRAGADEAAAALRRSPRPLRRPPRARPWSTSHTDRPS